jgi:hypothetical protein
MSFSFLFNAISIITGTIMKVINVANPSPNIIVHESGPQKATLSPPKKI